MTFYDKIVIVIYLLVLLISVFLGIYYKMTKPKEFYYLVILLIITFLVEFTSHYQLFMTKKVAGWLFAFFLPIQYCLLALYFQKIIKNVKVKKWIFASVPVVICWNACNSIFFQNFKMLNTYAILLACFLYCIWSFTYLVQLLQIEADEDLSQNPHFWICTGTLFFYASSFFIIGFIQIINKGNQELAAKLWFLIRVFNVILYGLYAYGLICQVKHQNLRISQ